MYVKILILKTHVKVQDNPTCQSQDMKLERMHNFIHWIVGGRRVIHVSRESMHEK